jgi:hypothetical protein
LLLWDGRKGRRKGGKNIEQKERGGERERHTNTLCNFKSRVIATKLRDDSVNKISA